MTFGKLSKHIYSCCLCELGLISRTRSQSPPWRKWGSGYLAALTGSWNCNTEKWGNAQASVNTIYDFTMQPFQKQMLIYMTLLLFIVFFFDFIWSLHFVVLIIRTEILWVNIINNSKHLNASEAYWGKLCGAPFHFVRSWGHIKWVVQEGRVSFRITKILFKSYWNLLRHPKLIFVDCGHEMTG